MAKQITPRKKKLPIASVDILATAFFTAFQTLPGAVRWRVVQMIEAWEDEREESWHMAEHMAYMNGESAVPGRDAVEQTGITSL